MRYAIKCNRHNIKRNRICINYVCPIPEHILRAKRASTLYYVYVNVTIKIALPTSWLLSSSQPNVEYQGGDIDMQITYCRRVQSCSIYVFCLHALLLHMRAHTQYSALGKTRKFTKNGPITRRVITHFHETTTNNMNLHINIIAWIVIVSLATAAYTTLTNADSIHFHFHFPVCYGKHLMT